MAGRQQRVNSVLKWFDITCDEEDLEPALCLPEQEKE